MKVVILGKGEMLSNLIEGTIDAGCEIAGVFRYERTVYSAWFLRLKDFFSASTDLTLVKKYNLYELKCSSANSEAFKREILKLNADIILTGTWGEKLSKEIINLPVIAAINAHPSLLPKYRGPNPYLQTILHGEMKSGITFHLINEEFDKGAILAQKEIEINPFDTSKELKERTVFQARLLWTELLKKLKSGFVIPIEQNETDASYYKNIRPEDMMLDFSKETATEISSRIRAFHPWLPCYITYKNHYFIPDPYKIYILNKNQILQYDNKKPNNIIDKNPGNRSITVLCKDGKALRFENIKVYGLVKNFFAKFIIKYLQ